MHTLIGKVLAKGQTCSISLKTTYQWASESPHITSCEALILYECLCEMYISMRKLVTSITVTCTMDKDKSLWSEPLTEE